MPRKNPFKLDVVSVRLAKEAPIVSDRRITGVSDAVAAMGDYLKEMDREVICILNLRTDHSPINCSMVSVGALSEAIAKPRELLKASILSNAACMIMLHNHPSGDLKPSKEDTMITDRMSKLCTLIGIELLDHILVAAYQKEYFSFREKGLIDQPQVSYEVRYQNLEMQQPKVEEKGRSR